MKIYRCHNCGDEVGPDDFDWAGRNGTRKAYVCNSSECHRELRREEQDEYEADREDALRRVDDDWGRR